MPTYICRLQKKDPTKLISRKRDWTEITPSLLTRILTVDENNDPTIAVIHHLLDYKRKRRFFKLIYNYEGSLDDVEAFKRYLPPIYCAFAADLDRLKEQLCSLYEIASKYTVLGVEQTVACYGCRNELMDQESHTECNTGCLHNTSECYLCSSIDEVP